MDSEGEGAIECAEIPGRRRIALGIEYDGSAFHGWQTQTHDPRSVQQLVEEALSRVADHPVKLVCAGRTDTGVHATQQVVHFDTTAQRGEKGWVFGANTHLPFSVALRWSREVPERFHARFSALSRSYRYLIYNHPIRPALLSKQLTWNYRPLDLDRMKRAASDLVGEHDFSAYRAAGCQSRSPVRTVYRLELARHHSLIVVDIEANAFLQHMVRNVVGVLMSIGAGYHDVRWAKEVLEGRDRTRGGVTAPPYGLYFVGVRYPEEFGIPCGELKIPQMPW